MDTRTGITSRAEVAAVPTLNIASDFVLSATGVALIPGAYGPGMWSLGATTESFATRSAIILSLPSDGSASVRRVPLLGEAMAQAVALEADGGLVVASSYGGEIDVGGTRFSAEGPSDVVLVRMR